MTSYWFYNMATIASEIYFRFPIWQRLAFRKVPELSGYQISTRYLNPRPRYYYSRFLKRNGSHIEILLRVSILTFSLPSACGFHRHTVFHRIRIIRGSYDVIAIFQDGGRQPCWIWFRVMVAHPRSASGGLCFILKFRLDGIYSFGDRGIFMLPIQDHFYGVLGAYFPQMTVSFSDGCRCNPQRAPPCAETRRFSHKTWKSVQRFDLGAGSRKRRTGQSKKSQLGLIVRNFQLLAEKLPLNRFHRDLHSSFRPRRNHVCKLLSWNFQGLRFYRLSNFPFSYWFLHRPCSANALSVIRWFSATKHVRGRQAQCF